MQQFRTALDVLTNEVHAAELYLVGRRQTIFAITSNSPCLYNELSALRQRFLPVFNLISRVSRFHRLANAIVTEVQILQLIILLE